MKSPHVPRAKSERSVAVRRIFWVPAVLALCCLASPAVAIEAADDGQIMLMGQWSRDGYCAPACAAPPFGTVPGCCQCQPSCCDHVWDGYCQEKWSRKGVFCGKIHCQPAPVVYQQVPCDGPKEGWVSEMFQMPQPVPDSTGHN